MDKLLKTLFEMQDTDYKIFHSALIPTVPEDSIIGIRIPNLRSFSKVFFKQPESKIFINSLPHNYYEEDNLHAFLIEQIKDYDQAIAETNKFLPFVNNWATCDMFMPKTFKINRDRLISEIMKWIKSDKPYIVRFAVKTLMNLYLDDHFDILHLETVACVNSKEYYVKMAVAWYFATALAKQYDSAVKYIKTKRLDVWTHNKTIQKATESKRIPENTKKYLKTFKITK